MKNGVFRLRGFLASKLPPHIMWFEGKNFTLGWHLLLAKFFSTQHVERSSLSEESKKITRAIFWFLCAASFVYCFA